MQNVIWATLIGFAWLVHPVNCELVNHVYKDPNDQSTINRLCFTVRCHPGEEAVICSEANKSASCRPCPPGSFHAEVLRSSEREDACKKHDQCDGDGARGRLWEQGTATSNNICVCDETRGFYYLGTMNKFNGTYEIDTCKQVPEPCPPGKEMNMTIGCINCPLGSYKNFSGYNACIECSKCDGGTLKPCSSFNDTVCEKFIALVLVVIVVIVIVGIRYRSRWGCSSSSRENPDENQESQNKLSERFFPSVTTESASRIIGNTNTQTTPVYEGVVHANGLATSSNNENGVTGQRTDENDKLTSVEVVSVHQETTGDSHSTEIVPSSSFSRSPRQPIKATDDLQGSSGQCPPDIAVAEQTPVVRVDQEKNEGCRSSKISLSSISSKSLEQPVTTTERQGSLTQDFRLIPCPPESKLSTSNQSGVNRYREGCWGEIDWSKKWFKQDLENKKLLPEKARKKVYLKNKREVDEELFDLVEKGGDESFETLVQILYKNNQTVVAEFLSERIVAKIRLEKPKLGGLSWAEAKALKDNVKLIAGELIVSDRLILGLHALDILKKEDKMDLEYDRRISTRGQVVYNSLLKTSVPQAFQLFCKELHDSDPNDRIGPHLMAAQEDVIRYLEEKAEDKHCIDDARTQDEIDAPLDHPATDESDETRLKQRLSNEPIVNNETRLKQRFSTEPVVDSETQLKQKLIDEPAVNNETLRKQWFGNEPVVYSETQLKQKLIDEKSNQRGNIAEEKLRLLQQ